MVTRCSSVFSFAIGSLTADNYTSLTNAFNSTLWQALGEYNLGRDKAAMITAQDGVYSQNLRAILSTFEAASLEEIQRATTYLASRISAAMGTTVSSKPLSDKKTISPLPPLTKYVANPSHGSIWLASDMSVRH